MKIRSRVAAAAIGLVTMVGGSLVAAAPAQAWPGVVHNCGAGVACLYGGPGFNYPITNAIAYGWENLYNVYGVKWYLNNQSPGWWAWACEGAGATGLCYGFQQDYSAPYTFVDWWDFTPVNSIWVTGP